MPVYNEGDRLAETLSDLAARAGENGHDVTVFVVDDGSQQPIVQGQKAMPSLRVVIARHLVNLGQGAAIETARRLALDPRWEATFDAFVTMDSDGQHRAEDAFALAAAIASGADV